MSEQTAPAETPSPAAQMSDPEPKKKGLPGWVKIAGALSVLVALVVVSRFLPLADWFFGAVDWVQGQGAVGVVVFIFLYAGATLIGGATPLTLAAGVIWGLWGVLIVSPASVLGASIAFLLGRFAMRKSVSGRIGTNPKFAAIEKAVEKEGFKIVALLRLSPAFPFTLLNYGLGVTPVRFGSYVLASFIGMLPGTLMYVYFGVLAGDLAEVFKGAPTTEVALTVDGNDVIAAFPEKGRATKKLTFTVKSEDGDVPEATYTWSFGDGESAEGATVKHKYKDGGDFKAMLEVTEFGSTAEAVIPVTPVAGFFDQYGTTILLIFGFLATVIVTVFVTRIARKALKEYIDDGDAEPPPAEAAS